VHDNRPEQLIAADPFDTVEHEGCEIQSAFLAFEDDFGRRCEVYAARCLAPGVAPPQPVVMHLPGGTQTVGPHDMSWWAKRGFACVSFDWQITDDAGHDPKRKSRWPAGVVQQSSGASRVEQLVLPCAVRAAGACIDWLGDDARFDADRVAVAGISWGGYLAWLVGAYEPRAKVLVPVYGSGGAALPTFDRDRALKATGDARAYWQQFLEPLNLADRQTAPVCYLSGTNDFFGYHDVAERLINALAVDKRRASVPNMSHHIGEASANLAVMWLNQHLCAGPAVPREPRLRDDLSVDADDALPIAQVEHWWTPAWGPDDTWCWHRGAPARGSGAKRVLARVHYDNGIAINTPTRTLDFEATPLDDVWPTATDGLGYFWGLASTQFHGPTVAVSAVAGDPSRCRFAVDRGNETGGDGHSISLMLRQVRDPRWNDGSIDAIDVYFDFTGAAELRERPTVETSLLHDDGGRSTHATRVPLEAVESQGGVTHRLRIELRSYSALPDWATWRHVARVWITGSVDPETYGVGPIVRRRIQP